MTKHINYQDYLISSLKDSEEATAYLNAALEGGDIKVFLLALYNVIQARGGVTKLSEKTRKSRTSIYKALSAEGNPYLKNINDMLQAIGMHFTIAVNTKKRPKKPKKAA